ncbi:MAG: acyl carrier protein [Clostridia bacterium]|nr:acyl carrier protein [Clostridia bacterium]
MKNMIERIKEAIAKQLRMSPDEIADDAAILEDLGADSLDVVEMLMTLEDEMSITIPDDDVASLRTVKDIADYLENVAG